MLGLQIYEMTKYHNHKKQVSVDYTIPSTYGILV